MASKKALKLKAAFSSILDLMERSNRAAQQFRQTAGSALNESSQ